MSYRITKLQPSVDALKKKANDAFVAKDFDKAIALYSDAIAAQPNAEVLYSNRSAAKLSKGDWKGALQDADKTIELAPKWSKAHARRAAALAAGGRHMGALMSMYNCVKLEATRESQAKVRKYYDDWMKPRHLSKPRRDIEEQRSFGDKCADEVAFAFARAYGLALPENATGADAKEALLQYKEMYPNGAPQVTRGLYLPSPDEPSQAARLVEIDPSKGTSPKSWEEVLNCQFIDEEVLYHEDFVEMWRGNDEGVGIGYLYHTYHVVMDDSAYANRVPNPVAAKLLQRPDAHGPLLVMKVLRLKDDTLLFERGSAGDAVAWEVVTKEELESDEWQEMRREFVELKRLNQMSYA